MDKLTEVKNLPLCISLSFQGEGDRFISEGAKPLQTTFMDKLMEVKNLPLCISLSFQGERGYKG